VAPARFELGNEELVRAHIHSVWLSAAGLNLKHTMIDVLDLEQASYPLLADHQHRIALSAEKLEPLKEECRHILDACGESVAAAPWYSAHWLDDTIQNAGKRFDQAFNRWRELYEAAVRHRDEWQQIFNKPTTGRRDRADAKRRVDEAMREIELLLNQSEEATESDFYPYRYLASEGFLPGYNFPRLPLRALVPTSQGLHVIDRPRFLGLPEFGPRNVIYHEGRKYRMARCILPPGGIESRLVTAKFCRMCGYLHDGEHTKVDRCDHCGVELDGNTSEYVQMLFEMSTTRGWRVERITCDEEERVREGFEVTTHYRFAPASDGKPVEKTAIASDVSGHELMRLTYAPQARLWRVNNKWRRSEHNGFTLDSKTGYWARRPGDDDDKAPDIETRDLKTGVRPFVRDTRNLLLVQP
jgi:hypothetical protein